MNRTRLASFPLLLCLTIGPASVWAQQQNETTQQPLAESATADFVLSDAKTDPVAKALPQASTETDDQIVLAAVADANPDETLAWQAVLMRASTDDVFAFIQKYPNGPYTKDAKALMIDLLWTDLSEVDVAPAEDVVEAAPAEDIAVVPTEPEIVTALPTGEVELQSNDGLVAVSGVIIAFDDALITIKTSFGTVGIENVGIACIGATCPTALLSTP